MPLRGIFLFSLSCLGLLFFSFCLLLSNNLSFLWLFMELCTLSLVPSFFVRRDRQTLNGLFSYLVVSSVASSLLMCGILWEAFLFLSVLGFLVKFGIFPFFGWVYIVMLKTNLFVAWGFSTILKIPFFLFPFFLSSAGFLVGWLELLFAVSFVFLAIFFWVYNYGLLHSWAHMMLSSSVVLIICSFVLSVESLLHLYLVYLAWATAVIIYIGRCGLLAAGGVGVSFFFVFLFLSFPLSFSLFYKLLSGACIYSCGFFVFLSWVFYGLSEQFYLFSFLLGKSVPRLGLGVLDFI